jgi:hypothetical protein
VALRATLQKLEQSLASPDDAALLAEIKKIVLLRIAEIDAAEALKNVAVAPNATVDAAPLESLPQKPTA